MNTLSNKLSDQIAVVAAIDPASLASSGTATSDYVDMGLFPNIMAVLQVGAFTSTGKTDAKLVQATASDGTGKKDITGKAITQLTQAGTDDNKQAVINCKADDLDINNSFRYVALEVNETTAACLVAGLILGAGRYAPASDNDVASVDEIV